MTARECLAIVATSLPGSRMVDRALYVGDEHVATATADDAGVIVRAALVYDGLTHRVPNGCDVSATKMSAHRHPVDRVLAAIRHREAARSKSMPVPLGDTGRDPTGANDPTAWRDGEGAVHNAESGT